MKCERCGREISESDSYSYMNQTLCEDCYVDLKFPAKTCDPWATYSATRTRESFGLRGEEGLTEAQKELYKFIKSEGKVAKEEAMENFSLSESQLESQLAVLRYSELIKGYQEGEKTYLVPFDQEMNSSKQ